jgi:hopanoid C-2 methylase
MGWSVMLDQMTIPDGEASGENDAAQLASLAQPRCILRVFPYCEASFGSSEHAHDITGSLRAFMPPQDLLVIGAALPRKAAASALNASRYSTKPR